MKFVKGIILGTIVSAGVALIADTTMNKSKIMKKGRKFIKKMGII